MLFEKGKINRFFWEPVFSLSWRQTTLRQRHVCSRHSSLWITEVLFYEKSFPMFLYWGSEQIRTVFHGDHLSVNGSPLSLCLQTLRNGLKKPPPPTVTSNTLSLGCLNSNSWQNSFGQNVDILLWSQVSISIEKGNSTLLRLRPVPDRVLFCCHFSQSSPELVLLRRLSSNIHIWRNVVHNKPINPDI